MAFVGSGYCLLPVPAAVPEVFSLQGGFQEGRRARALKAGAGPEIGVKVSP